MRVRMIATHIRTLLSLVLFLHGDWESATQLVEESLKRSRDLNIGTLIGYAEGFAGLYESMAGNYAQGRPLCERSRDNPANHGLGLFVAHWGMTTALCGLGAEDAAWEALQAGFQQTQVADAVALAMCLMPVTAILLDRRGRSEQAAKALALVSTHPLSQQGWLGKWDLFQETQNELKDEMEELITRAGSQSPENSIAEIKEMVGIVTGVQKPADANQALIEPLTNRELEVLQLITDGLSNREIADKLVISTGTAKYYTSQIYRKLQVTSRTQAIAMARELEILE